MTLSSANSINIARLIPQSFYYFYSYSQLKSHELPVVYSIPSGNFGNLTGGLLAHKMGLPILTFIAATNINLEVAVTHEHFRARYSFSKTQQLHGIVSSVFRCVHCSPGEKSPAKAEYPPPCRARGGALWELHSADNTGQPGTVPE